MYVSYYVITTCVPKVSLFLQILRDIPAKYFFLYDLTKSKLESYEMVNLSYLSLLLLFQMLLHLQGVPIAKPLRNCA